ncbi:MAG: bifunctional metallophosphatase/5'-nucleotidase [Candidatus Cloacimonetes bacterium]|jgi:5'-nucleotidase / UDP-sugar diphosphatase|nr:bifunctional metallophosphatase/5'-nucleotidase [Candidatus Cloacimonadota bacterium]MBT6993725.1 bifunctional metallophosphatase/5'-nucleotidase [Candidatus Cloacimonadota bacterium]MBT7468818.1 bifunctional metallophosphatase/5'-nucleotidase [Candidatus Cloacimonadota bacterium]
MVGNKMKKIFFFLFIFSVLFAEDLLLDVMFTNDIHGGIDRYEATFMNPEFPPMLGGGGSAATYIQSVRNLTDGKKRDNFLVDAGDFFQGHPIGTMSKGDAVIDYFNMVNYDLSVVGNHEYDISEDELIETYAKAKFPILSCNIINKKTGELVDYVTPYLIYEKMGLKIGIIGLTTTDTETMSFPEHIANIDVLPAKPELIKYIAKIRDQVDLIFVVGHMGIPYDPQPAYNRRYKSNKPKPNEVRRWGYDAQELAHEVEGIDLFVGGHIHKGFADPWVDPVNHTLVVQGYAMGSNVGHLILKIDAETKTISGYETPAIREGMMITLFEDEWIPNPEISAEILEMQKVAETGMNDVIGEAAVHLSKAGVGPQNVIGNVVCEAMKEFTDADFAFMNLGGIRADIGRGPITYRDVFDVMPFDNKIVMFEVDGNFLKEIIEMRVSGSRHGLRVAGINVVINKKRESYNRISKLLIGGEEWKADKIYKIVTTDFLLQGNAGLVLLTKIPEEQITRYEKDLRDAIVEYIKNNSPVTMEIDNRWKYDDKSKISASIKAELEK